MAHFYGSVHGNGPEATLTGSKNGGIMAHARGWDVGARVAVRVDSDGSDVVDVYLTRGSNDSSTARFLGTFKRRGNQVIKVRG